MRRKEARAGADCASLEAKGIVEFFQASGLFLHGDGVLGAKQEGDARECREGFYGQLYLPTKVVKRSDGSGREFTA